jgi:hypothetical protein
LDREVSAHISNAFESMMQRMMGKDVALAAQLRMKVPL